MVASPVMYGGQVISTPSGTASVKQDLADQLARWLEAVPSVAGIHVCARLTAPDRPRPGRGRGGGPRCRGRPPRRLLRRPASAGIGDRLRRHSHRSDRGRSGAAGELLRRGGSRLGVLGRRAAQLGCQLNALSGFVDQSLVLAEVARPGAPRPPARRGLPPPGATRERCCPPPAAVPHRPPRDRSGSPGRRRPRSAPLATRVASPPGRHRPPPPGGYSGRGFC